MGTDTRWEYMGSTLNKDISLRKISEITQLRITINDKLGAYVATPSISKKNDNVIIIEWLPG